MRRIVILACLLVAAFARPGFAADANYRVAVAGHGPDVLMIPGLGCSGAVWARTAKHLDARFTTHVFTLAGFGGVPPVDGPFFKQRLAALDAYLKANRIAHATLIGHSLGGLIAMKLALLEPARIDRVVIVDSLPFLAGGMLGASSVEAAAPQIAMLRDGLKSTPRARFLAQEKLSIAGLVTSPENRKLVYSWVAASDQATIAEATYEDLSSDIRGDIGAIKAKVLVLYPWRAGGAFSRAATDAIYHDQFAPMAHVKLERIDDSLHFIMLDQPAEYLAALDAFLKK